jgi:hypothetical protein
MRGGTGSLRADAEISTHRQEAVTCSGFSVKIKGTLHGLVGNWFIFRRKDVFCGTSSAENTDLSPSHGLSPDP